MKRVYYSTKTPIIPEKKWKKLDDIYIRKIIDLSKVKATSEISSEGVNDLINNYLKKDKKDINLTKMKVCWNLKEKYGTSRKVKRFYILVKNKNRKELNFRNKNIKKIYLEVILF